MRVLFQNSEGWNAKYRIFQILQRTRIMESWTTEWTNSSLNTLHHKEGPLDERQEETRDGDDAQVGRTSW